MSVAEKTLEVFEDIYRGIAAMFSISPDFIVDWETVVHPNTIVTKRGELITFMSLDGFCGIVGDNELERIVGAVRNATASLFSGSGTEMTFTFLRERFHEDEVHAILKPSFDTAESLGLNLTDVLESKKRVTLQWSRRESAMIMIKTTTAALTKSEAKDVVKKARQAAKNGVVVGADPALREYEKSNKVRRPIAQGVYAAYPRAFYEILFNRHRAVVESLITDFKAADILVREKPIHDVFTLFRRTLMPEGTSMDWKPCLPGDKIPVREKMRTDKNDTSHRYYPSLVSQLFPEGAGESRGSDLQVVGNSVFAPVQMKLPPQNVQPFNQLFSSLQAADIPYWVSIRLRAGCLSTLNENLAAGLSFLPGATNKQIVRAFEDVKESIIQGDLMCGLQVMGCTWAPKRLGAGEISRRSSLLVQAFQSWGAAEATGVIGDPLYGLCGALGLSKKMPAPTAVPPLSDILPMCPLSRPVSPWEHGALLLRSGDGKLLPYQPGSSLQTAWVVLGFAPMGFGKSVFSNAMNAALVMLPGANELPYISVLDIGISSSGMVSLIKSALPEGKKHLAQYVRLTNQKKHAINVFDTPLGMRSPVPAHRAFLTNFLSLLCMSAREQATYPNVDGLLRMIVDKVYENLSDRYNPKRYDSSICPEEVLRAMSDIGYHPDEQTTWWEIVDALAGRTLYHEAALAQRYAVPTLADCSSAVRGDAVAEIYKDLTPGNVPVTEYVWRQIIDAMNMFPNLAMATQFDLGETRICAIDLEEVAPAGSDLADRQTAIMYMVARHVSCSKFFFKESELELVPEAYLAYHKPRVLAMGTLVKAIVYDEFHRTANAPAVRDQVLRDIREGRKWRVLVSLFSQRASDFDKSIVDLATSIFILGGGSEEGIRDVSNAFALSETETRFVRNISKPSSKGSSMLALHITSRGRVVQPVYLTLAPEEIWAYTTTAEDRRVRDELYKRMDPRIARQILAKRYSGGSLGRGDKEFTDADFTRIADELEREAFTLTED